MRLDNFGHFRYKQEEPGERRQTARERLNLCIVLIPPMNWTIILSSLFLNRNSKLLFLVYIFKFLIFGTLFLIFTITFVLMTHMSYYKCIRVLTTFPYICTDSVTIFIDCQNRKIVSQN